MNRQICHIVIVICILFFCLYPNNVIADRGDNKSLNQQMTLLNQRVDKIENLNRSEQIDQVLTFSNNTVKYVGVFASIVLPLIILLIGHQIIRSYQFEREIRDIRQLMMNEYDKIVKISSESDQFTKQIKDKLSNLEGFIGDLATDFLIKKTKEIAKEAKEERDKIFEEVKTKVDEVTSTAEGDIGKSLELMKKLENLDLTLTPSIYVERGLIYLNQKDNDRAIDNFTNAIELKGNLFDAHHNRGIAYLRKQVLDKAYDDLKIAEKFEPKNPIVVYNIGILYRAKKDYETSIKYLSKAIELDSKNTMAHIARAHTYTLWGKHDLAINDFNEALKLNPDDDGVKFSIAHLYGKLGNFPQAIKYYSDIKKSNVSSMMNLAEAYICSKDYSSGEKTANECQALSSDIRDRVFSKYLLILSLILGNKEYILELKSLTNLLKEDCFEIKDWSFEEVLGCLSKNEIGNENKELVDNIIKYIKGEINEEILFSQSN